MGAVGDAHPRATVTEDQVRQIIQLLQSRKTQKEVARQFGVNRLVVEGIASGRHWQHVPRPANFDTTIRHRAKLTEDQVREIRYLLKAGHSQGGIAKRFDVVRTTIRDITTGRTWGWLADRWPNEGSPLKQFYCGRAGWIWLDQNSSPSW